MSMKDYVTVQPYFMATVSLT